MICPSNRARCPLSCEALEARLLHAGDVQVWVDRLELHIRGDFAANDVHVFRDAQGQVLVAGRHGTTVNGQANPLVAFAAGGPALRALDARLKHGDDTLEIEGITLTGAMDVRGGKGADRVVLANVTGGNLQMALAAGDDVVEMTDVRLSSRAALLLGAGEDVAAWDNVAIGGRSIVRGHAGNDTIAALGLQVASEARWNLGRGHDRLAVTGDAVFTSHASIVGGEGDDDVVFTPQQTGGQVDWRSSIVVSLGRGDDRLVMGNNTAATGQVSIRGGAGNDTWEDDSLAMAGRAQVHSIRRGDIAETAVIDAVFARLADVGIDTGPFTGDSRQPPVVTMSTGPLTFVENDAPLPVDAQMTVSDPDSAQLSSAAVRLAEGYQPGADLLATTGAAGIQVQFDAARGELRLTGSASLATYEQVLRSVTYQNTSQDPTSATRRIVVEVRDSDGNLATATRQIEVQPVDDSGQIVLPPEFSQPASVPQRPLDAPIAFSASVNDPDDADYVFQLDLESSGIPAGAALPTIDPTTGAFRWTPTTTGRFELRIIVVNGSGWANQQTFLIDIVPA